MVHSECTGGGLVKPETKRQKVLQVEIWAGRALLFLEVSCRIVLIACRNEHSLRNYSPAELKGVLALFYFIIACCVASCKTIPASVKSFAGCLLDCTSAAYLGHSRQICTQAIWPLYKKKPQHRCQSPTIWLRNSMMYLISSRNAPEIYWSNPRNFLDPPPGPLSSESTRLHINW
jgi:hypothetical protein